MLKNPTRNSNHRQNKRHNTFHNRHAKYSKNTESRLRSTTDQPSYVISTSGQRQSMPLNSGTLCRRKTRPELVLPFTASVTTLFHNRHAKYRKYTESRLRSTTDQPSYVPSTSGQRQSMPLKLRHPLKEKNRPLIVFPVTASVTTLFHNRHAKYRKYTESRLRSTTDQPSYVPSTSGQRYSMPLKLRHPLKEKNRPLIVFPVTASVTTLFHNRHAKYSKIH
jgi:shikimate kinase